MNVSERITELWKTWRFVDAIDLFNQKILEDSFTGEEVAEFWGLIEAECEKNREVIFHLYQMLRASKNWDDRAMCKGLRISGKALDDIKNGWNPASEAVGLKIYTNSFLKWLSDSKQGLRCLIYLKDGWVKRRLSWACG